MGFFQTSIHNISRVHIATRDHLCSQRNASVFPSGCRHFLNNQTSPVRCGDRILRGRGALRWGAGRSGTLGWGWEPQLRPKPILARQPHF